LKKRETVLGIEFDDLSKKDFLAVIDNNLKSKTKLGGMRIEGLNISKIVDAKKDSSLNQALCDAELVHLDGMGAWMAARLTGVRCKGNVPGIELMDSIIALCAPSQNSVYFLGAKEEVVSKTASFFQDRYSRLKIAGYRDGYFGHQDYSSVVSEINESDAAILFIGISSPKKEIFLHTMWSELPKVKIAMGVGGSFDVYSGTIKRAPVWMSKMGFEWLYRLAQEPRRLFWRYCKSNASMIWLIIKFYLRKITLRLWI
jgi:N-acetylglucosaminyldiphosphoundecaprenol N-acetyl-beta-D-mannosaminyltransferase